MSGTEGELLILHASEEENKEDSVPVHAELSEQILEEKAQLISAGEERFESPGIDDEEESTSLLETQTRRQTGTTKFKKSGQLNIGAGGDPDDNPYDGEDFDGGSGPRRAAGRGYSGSRLLQNISLDDGRYLPKLPKRTLPTPNQEQRVLDFYQTLKSHKDYGKESELIRSRH